MQVSLNLNSAESVLQAVLEVRNNQNFLKEIAKTIVVPDIHGHPLKLFFFILCTGVIKLDTEEEKEAFKEKYAELVAAYKEKNAEAFFNALNKFSLNTKIIEEYKQLLLTILMIIGDTRCDRAKGGDDLMIEFDRWLQKSNIKWEELFSNHSAGTLALYHHLKDKSAKERKEILIDLDELAKPALNLAEKATKNKDNSKETWEKIDKESQVFQKKAVEKKSLAKMKTLAGYSITGIAVYQCVSLFNMITRIKDDDEKINEFIKNIESYYIPNVKLISYQTCGKTFNLYAHTSISILTVIETAKAFGIKTNTDTIPTVAQVIQLIDEINTEFSEFAKGTKKPEKKQLKKIERITCLRGMTTNEDKKNKEFAKENQLESLNIVFGHIGDQNLNLLFEGLDNGNYTEGRTDLKYENINTKNVAYHNIDSSNNLGKSDSNLPQKTNVFIFYTDPEKKESAERFNKKVEPTHIKITIHTHPQSSEKKDEDGKENPNQGGNEQDKSDTILPLTSKSNQTKSTTHYFFQGLKITITGGTVATGATLILTGVGELTKQTLMFTALSGFLLAHAAPPVLIATGCALLVFTIAIAFYCYRNQKKSNQIKTVLSPESKKPQKDEEEIQPSVTPPFQFP